MNPFQLLRLSYLSRFFPAQSLRIFAAFVVVLILSACGSGGSPSSPEQPIISKISIAPTTPAPIVVGGNEKFVATALDPAGQEIPSIDVSWQTSNPAVASVDSNGVVTGLANGTATLTASFGSATSDPITLQIMPVTTSPPPRPPIAAVQVMSASPSGTVSRGNQVQFTAVAKDAADQPISGVKFTWGSSDASVVSIDPASGLATAQGPGKATITATADDGTSHGTGSLTVLPNKAPIAQMTVTPTSGTAPLTVTVDGTGSVDPDGIISTYSWDFQESPGATTPTATHTYQNAGSYKIVLIVTDSNGATATTSATVTVRPPPGGTPPPGGGTPPPVGTGWKTAPTHGADLFGVSFVSATEGWTVGIDQAIEHSTDGGHTWTPQQNIVFNGSAAPSRDALVDFYDVFFVDAKTGWAIGWPEAIFKTIDGGATWAEQHLNRAAWTDRSGPKGSPDGVWDHWDWCEIWDAAAQACSKKYGSYLRKVQFFDSQHGWTVGRFGFMFKTDNGGASWTEIPNNSTVRPLPAPCVYPAGNAQAGQPRPAVTSYSPHLFTVDVITPNDIWIGGGSEGDEPCDKGWLRMLGHTTDGGQHWQFIYEAENGGQLEGHGRIFDLRFGRNPDGSGGLVGFAVGGNGTSQSNVLQTTDGGQTWHQIRAASYPAYANGFYGVAFISPSQVWVAGWNGLILHSEDGGATWSRQQANTTDQLRHIFFLDVNTGWIAGQHNNFYTTSGGK